MQEKYTELPMSSDGFIKMVELFIDNFLLYLADRLKGYSGVECTFENELLKIGDFELDVKRKVCFYEGYKKDNLPPPIQLVFECGARSSYKVGIGFYYDSIHRVHTFNLFHDLVNINNFKNYIYAYYYYYPDFLLKELKERSFLALLADEFISQLAWNIPSFREFLMEKAAPDFREKLSGELEFKEFAHSFFSKGFTVFKHKIYMTYNPERGYSFPDGEKPLYVKEGDLKDGELYARFDRGRKWFFAIDQEEVVVFPQLWRYARKVDMERFLEDNGLGDYGRYILNGQGLGMTDSKTMPMRELLMTLFV